MNPKAGMFAPKVGIVLAVAATVAGCATPLPTSFSGQCLIQPVAAQQGMMVANVYCEKGE